MPITVALFNCRSPKIKVVPKPLEVDVTQHLSHAFFELAKDTWERTLTSGSKCGGAEEQSHSTEPQVVHHCGFSVDMKCPPQTYIRICEERLDHTGPDLTHGLTYRDSQLIRLLEEDR